MSILKFGFTFQDLYIRSQLLKLDNTFINYVKKHNENLLNQLVSARHEKAGNSDLIIELSYLLEIFMTELFQIEITIEHLRKKHEDFLILYKCKRLFVQRYAVKKYQDFNNLDTEAIKKDMLSLFTLPICEQSFAKKVLFWLENQQKYTKELEIVGQYSAYMVFSNKDHAKKKISLQKNCQMQNSIMFQIPNKIDYDNLIPTVEQYSNQIKILKSEKIYRRSGFNLTQEKPTLNQSLNNAHYCIFCHKQNKDSCSKGLQNKNVKCSPLNNELHGCPLEEKISEMNLLKSQGYLIASLAVIMIDNPLCVLTGYRICNDCKKSCIYQKQDPVDIPLVETQVVNDVLELPYGFEIYSLLTRWNPLNFERPLPREDTYKNVLVVGLGPAGINLSHHLLNDGHNVVAIDGLKIEPLAENISGITQNGTKTNFQPIKNIHNELFENLSERTAYGFGGVSEYGITVRWNKNYLKIARLILERRKNFAMHGSIRFGSTITVNDAFNLGFHHISLALGAGKPHMIDIKNSMARGVRMASDFLMTLQLTGAARNDSISNLQVRLPLVVIGGGLTAIDAATEALAYYPIQVEKFLSRYEILIEKYGKQYIEEKWSTEEAIIANEFLAHALKIRQEKELANKENRSAKILELLQDWGGVKIIYRKKLQDSPGYKLNSEEVEHALTEGIHFIENLHPIEIVVDEFHHTKGIICQTQEGLHRSIEAKNIIIAIGTEQNTELYKEDPEHFKLNRENIIIFDALGIPTQQLQNYNKFLKKDNIFLYNNYNKSISICGDLHPSYRGSVVKAMASAKNSYSVITKLLQPKDTQTNKFTNTKSCIKQINNITSSNTHIFESKSSENSDKFFMKINHLFRSYVVTIEYIAPKILELTIKSPMAAQNFQPGQFYRLHNFEANSIEINNKQKTKIAMEGLALTGVSVNKKEGLISTIILETGGSTNLCSSLKKDEYISLMGPTGSPTEIPNNECVMLIGGGVGNAVLFSIGQSMIKNKCRVLYFAGYKKLENVFKMSSIEQASNFVIWCCDEHKITPRRQHDKSFHGNVIDAILSYQNGTLGYTNINLQEIDRIIVIGSNYMMEAVNNVTKTTLKPFLKPTVKLVASVNSPMQCMMKEICAQCLQQHIDPLTGKHHFTYSCSNQDQNLDNVDFTFLNERLKQNSLQEKLTAKWIKYCLN